MKRLLKHIEHVKTKPHHVRRQVALTAAGTISGMIALVWLVGNLSLGTFAIEGSTFADATNADATPIVRTGNTGQLAAVGAAGSEDKNAPAYIQIVDTTPQATTTHKAEQTVIPF